MKRKRHTPEEIVKKLRTAEEALACAKTAKEACRIIAVSMATYQRWKSQYSGVKKDALKRLKELEKESVRLKRLLAEQALDMNILKEIAEGKWQARPASAKRWRICATA
jgi:putative transposase